MASPIQRAKEALGRGRQFVNTGVWQIGKPGEEIPKGFVIKQIRVAILLGSKLIDGTHMIRASALAFATILSIVPFLAVTFYIIQTFNLGEDLYGLVQDRLEATVTQVSETLSFDESDANQDKDGEAGPETGPGAAGDADADEGAAPAPERAPPPRDVAEAAVSPDARSETAEQGEGESQTDESADKSRELQQGIVRSLFQGVAQQQQEGMRDPVQDMVDQVTSLAREAATNPAALTISGILLVLTTVFGLMRNLENTFNRIWGVRRNRSWYRMFTDYVVVTLLLPFVAAVVLGAMAALHSDSIAQALGPAMAYGLRFSQHVMIVMVFTLLYKLVPSTRVEFRYALLAGLVAGTLWILLSLSYVVFQVGLTRYAVMLSAFAQIPMLLTWIYLSWAILLLGCEVAYAYQNESTFAMERFADGASYAYREAVGLRAMLEIGRRFVGSMPRLSLEQMAQQWNVPMRLLRESVESLIEAGYVTACATEPVTYQPGCPLDQIRVGDVVTVSREVGHEPSAFRQDDAFKPIFDELARRQDDFGGATIAELAEGLKPSVAVREASEPLNA